jgi:CheY-like chemotaxis protein
MSEKQLSFLYVDDDPGSRRLIQIIMTVVLKYSDLTVFDSSEHFMEKVRGLPAVPDLIFLDVQITPHDGYDMLKMLRSDPTYANTRVIAMTASVMSSDVERLKTAGFDGMIGKPIRKRLFPDQLKQIMSGEPVWIVY